MSEEVRIAALVPAAELARAGELDGAKDDLYARAESEKTAVSEDARASALRPRARSENAAVSEEALTSALVCRAESENAGISGSSKPDL